MLVHSRCLRVGAVATKAVEDNKYRVAASAAVMRSGRHFAQLTTLNGEMLFFGAIQSGWDNAFNADGHCSYSTNDGHRDPGGWVWQGRRAATKQGDRIGMLLDLDQGSMTVWKNGVRLGVMWAEGLTGPLCWLGGRSGFGRRQCAHRVGAAAR